MVKYFYHIYVTIMKGKRKLSSYRSLHGIEKYYPKDRGIQKVAPGTLIEHLNFSILNCNIFLEASSNDTNLINKGGWLKFEFHFVLNVIFVS